MIDAGSSQARPKGESIRPFPSINRYTPRYEAASAALQPRSPRTWLGRQRLEKKLIVLRGKLVDEPVQREFFQAVRELSPSEPVRLYAARVLDRWDQLLQERPRTRSARRQWRRELQALHWAVIDIDSAVNYGDAPSHGVADQIPPGNGNDLLFSCKGGADALAICGAVGLTKGLYADLPGRAWQSWELLMRAVGDSMPMSGGDWQMIYEIILSVVWGIESAVFILRDVKGAGPWVGRFAAAVVDAVKQGPPLRGPVAVVLDGWDQDLFDVGEHWPGARPDPSPMPVRHLSL